LLRLRLGQLAVRTGVRGRITESRVKRPAKAWENTTRAGLTEVEAFTRVEDFIGIRHLPDEPFLLIQPYNNHEARQAVGKCYRLIGYLQKE